MNGRCHIKKNETLTKFRVAVSESTDLQEKVKAGADLVALGKENGFEFTQEELITGWRQLQELDEGLTEFELDVLVAAAVARIGRRFDRMRLQLQEPDEGLTKTTHWEILSKLPIPTPSQSD